MWCRPAHGLYNLQGPERLLHFEALFDAADVSRDGQLDIVELRHLLNPHITKNKQLRRAALNMTVADELCVLPLLLVQTSCRLANSVPA